MAKNKFPSYKLEKELRDKGYKNIIGIDEAGRGCGSGPVVASAVYIPDNMIYELLGKVNDSKKLSEKKRKKLFDIILEKCYVSTGIVDNKIIDDINILEATKLAMTKAVNKFDFIDYILIDGNFTLNNVWYDQQSIIGGDSKSLSIATASIIAKVTRDNMMAELHKKFPVYYWDKNKGYLTKQHREAINKYGACVYHRLSYKGVI